MTLTTSRSSQLTNNLTTDRASNKTKGLVAEWHVENGKLVQRWFVTTR